MLYNAANIPSAPLCKILSANQIRRPSAPVDLTDTAKIQELIHKMIRACVVNGGVGLAAPQIGVFKRLFIAMESPGLFRAYINPSFKPVGNRKVEDTEACLSVSGKNISVSRYETITVNWTEIDSDGTIQTMGGMREGYKARVFQHEYDHLNSISILDRYTYQHGKKK